jgi:hypothetical protein
VNRRQRRPREGGPIHTNDTNTRVLSGQRRQSTVLGLAAASLIWLALPALAAESGGDVMTAGSVCEAQKLKKLLEEDPDLHIEIPAEFNKQWPSYDACISHELAWNAGAPGPMQPIPFSHKHHAGKFGIDCQYCHSGTDRSAAAGVPSVELCMGCHAQFPKEYDELEGIQILKQHWEEKKTIEWQQIHRLPEHVQFKHNRHIAAGLECQRCHGQVQEMEKAYLTKDTVWWPWGLPAQKLEMGWCISCHRENNQQASQDCLTCHY